MTSMGKNKASKDGLYAACRIILDFLAERGRLANLDQFHTALRDAYDAGSIRALRAAFADLQGRARAVPYEEQQVLAGRLADAGLTIPLASGDKIEAILKRGRINTEAEYRLVASRVEEVYEDPSNAELVDNLNKLLTEAYDRQLK